MGIISTKLRSSARDQVCTFQIPGVCNYSTDTTVLCHAPSQTKGMGNKGNDFHAAFGCCACHEALDQHRLTREEELYYWLRGTEKTMLAWVEAGLIILPVDPKKAKRRPAKKSKWPSRKIPPRGFSHSLPQEAPDDRNA